MNYIERKEFLNDEEYAQIMKKESHHDHKIIKDEEGIYRWEKNEKVNDHVQKIGLNEIIILFILLGYDKNSEPYRKLYRDIGFSIYGYWEIFYWEMNNEEAKKYKPKKK